LGRERREEEGETNLSNEKEKKGKEQI